MVLVGRVDLEERERALLGPLGRLSEESLGRAALEEPDPLRTCFQCDRDRILHSKSFRRLAHKTQVFLAPEGGPLPHAAHPYPRGGPGGSIHREAARAQRGPD